MAKKDGRSAAADFVAGMNKKAERLAEVRANLAQREEQYKRDTDAWFAEEKELRLQILEDLKALNLKSVSAPNGERYSITRKPTFEIENPLAMERWAVEQKLVTVSKEMVKSKLERLHKENALPDFVKVGERETITIVKPKADKEEAPAGGEAGE